MPPTTEALLQRKKKIPIKWLKPIKPLRITGGSFWPGVAAFTELRSHPAMLQKPLSVIKDMRIRKDRNLTRL
jgi:hypothetical protein